MTGRIISHYRIEGTLGEGGMGIVYAATDTSLGRRVAVKLCRPARANSGARDELVREARAASQLNHPNIAQIYDLGETSEGLPFFVMELLSGENLAQRLKSGPLPWREALHVARGVASALAEAHRHGIIHRDIKPGNIVAAPGGEVKVLDFGLARMLEPPSAPSLDPDQTLVCDPSLTVAGTLKGTPGYLSPEQSLGGPVDHRTDLFSLGCVLYECLTGTRPFLADTLADSLLSVRTSTPRRPSESGGSPRALDPIVSKLLEKDPQRRYSSAAEVVSALDALAGLRRPPTPLRRIWWAAAAALSLGAAVLAYNLWNAPHQPASHVARWYSDGLNAMRDGTYLKASLAFEQAIRQDSAFAMAHARLAEAWFEMDYSDRARESLLRAQRIAPGGRRLSSTDALTVEAIDFLLTGDFDQSLHRYQAIADQAPPDEKAWALLDLGRAHDRQGQAAKALQAYRQAVTANSQCAACFLRLAADATRMRLFPEATQALDRASPLYSAASNAEGAVEVESARALMNVAQGNNRQALQQIEHALASARAAGNLQQQVKLLLQRANIWVNEGNVALSQQEAQLAVDLARSNGVEALAARSLRQLGNAYFLKNRYSEAEALFSQALEMARRNHSRAIEAQSLASLGILHVSTGAAAKAQAELTAALPLLRRAGYLKSAFDAGIMLTRILRDKGDLTGARATINEQARDAEQRRDVADQAMAEEGLGTVLALQQRYGEAAASLARARQLASTVNPLQTGFLLVGEAAQRWRIGAFDSAAALFAEAAKRQQSSHLAALAADLAIERGEMELARGRAHAALALLAEAHSALDANNQPGQVESLRLTGLAQARAGRPADGWKSCEIALATASRVENPQLVSRARLSCAETALLAGHPQKAAELAALARSWIAAAGQLESGWRACLLIAAAGADRGSMTRQARIDLRNLESSWPPTDWKGYRERADVRLMLEQLNKLEAVVQ